LSFSLFWLLWSNRVKFKYRLRREARMPNPPQLKEFSRGEQLSTGVLSGSFRIGVHCPVSGLYHIFPSGASWGGAKSYLAKGQNGIRAQGLVSYPNANLFSPLFTFLSIHRRNSSQGSIGKKKVELLLKSWWSALKDTIKLHIFRVCPSSCSIKISLLPGSVHSKRCYFS